MRFSLLLLLLFNAAALAMLQASWAHAVQTRSLAMAPAVNKRLAAGVAHFNYVQDNGQVYSWGKSEGLGAGDVPNSAFPIQMLGVSHATSVSSCYRHTCVVDGGAAKCCGVDYHGQLGNGANADSFTVVQVQGLTAGVKQVVAGVYHSCAVLSTGGMRCWGDARYGQLGYGSYEETNVPVPVTNYALSSVHSACAGAFYTCIVTTGGAALCTGEGIWGQLGNNGTINKNIMTQVTGLTDGTVTQISCGSGHTCAVTNTGGVACFGQDTYGALGFDYGSHQATPVYPVGLQAGVITVMAGGRSTCVIDNHAARTARCFGKQDYSQFANSNATDKNFSPVVFGGGITGIVEIAVSDSTICILDEFGGVQCVGDSNYFQLGSGSNQTDPRETLDYVVGFPVTSAPTLMPTNLAPTTSAPTVTTSAPTATTSAPTATTSAPTVTTSVPTVTTLAPTTSAPTTSAPTSGANLLFQPIAGYAAAALLLAAMLA